MRRSALHDRLVAAGARFAESSGWENTSYFAPPGAEVEFRYTYGRPDWFEYHAAEHHSVRNDVALFDMSAMSKFLVQGPDAESLLNHLSGNDVAVPAGRCVYTQWMNERGCVMADVTITRLADDRFQVVVAEAFHRRVDSMLRRATPPGARVYVTDVTSGFALLSVQGPNSRALLAELTTADLSNEAFPYLTAQEIDLHHARALAVRMSFVGELGWELFVPTEFALGVYDRLVEAGAAHGLAHAGMATLESTRTEAGRLDYGLDMENSDSPLEAGLKFAIDFDKPGGFVGRDALLAQYEQRPYTTRLVQFLLTDPEPLLHGEEPILLGGDVVGYVRSGAYGHTLGGAMGFGYVDHADGVTPTSTTALIVGPESSERLRGEARQRRGSTDRIRGGADRNGSSTAHRRSSHGATSPACSVAASGVLAERSVELLGRLHSTGSWPNSQPTTARDVRRSALHDRLVAAGARFAESSGWENTSYVAPPGAEIEFRYTYGRPDWFEYHAAEHHSVRNDVALFDMSAMSKFLVQGPDAESLLNRLSGNDVAVPAGRCVYTQWMNERGRVMADVTITRLADDRFQVVVAEAFHRRVDVDAATSDAPGRSRVRHRRHLRLRAAQRAGSELAGAARRADDRRSVERGVPVPDRTGDRPPPRPRARGADELRRRTRLGAVRPDRVRARCVRPSRRGRGCARPRPRRHGDAREHPHRGRPARLRPRHGELRLAARGRPEVRRSTSTSPAASSAGTRCSPSSSSGRTRRDSCSSCSPIPNPCSTARNRSCSAANVVGYVRSGAYGHTLGGAMGFGYVDHADGVTGRPGRERRLRDRRRR